MNCILPMPTHFRIFRVSYLRRNDGAWKLVAVHCRAVNVFLDPKDIFLNAGCLVNPLLDMLSDFPPSEVQVGSCPDYRRMLKFPPQTRKIRLLAYGLHVHGFKLAFPLATSCKFQPRTQCFIMLLGTAEFICSGFEPA